jgi:SulP family sulfate permease
LATFLLTVFVDLTVAVEVGLLFSLVLFVKRMTDVTSIREVTAELDRGETDRNPDASKAVPPGVQVYEAEGAFFFGFASQLRDVLELSATGPKAAILRMNHVLALDASGLRALLDLSKTCRKAGVTFIICGLREQPRRALERSGILAELGTGGVAPDLGRALALARERLV